MGDIAHGGSWESPLTVSVARAAGAVVVLRLAHSHCFFAVALVLVASVAVLEGEFDIAFPILHHSDCPHREDHRQIDCGEG